MAACDLKIILDDPKKVYAGGETVSGVVEVTSHDAARCNGLEMTSLWRTHGRGNTATGNADLVELYSGNWDTQAKYSYPFKIKTAEWPPTYYGNYVNVSHFLSARAKLSWKSDPRTETEILVLTREAPEGLKPTDNKVVQKSSWIGVVLGWTVGLALIAVLLVFLTGIALVVLPFVLIGGGIYWFVFRLLPRLIVGQVECAIANPRVRPGEMVQGTLKFTPRKSSAIQGVYWTIKCVEKCVSGSGSNRKTHQHEVFQNRNELQSAVQLKAGQPYSYDFSFVVPDQPAPSLKLSDNEVNWTGEVRIAISGWPDWSKEFALTILPGDGAQLAAAGPQYDAGADDDEENSVFEHEEPVDDEDAWFQQMLDQVNQSASDPERMATILEALSDQVFTIRVDLSSVVPSPTRLDPGIAGTWMDAMHPKLDEDLYLLWPKPMTPPEGFTNNFRATAKIIGFDHDIQALIMQIEPVA